MLGRFADFVSRYAKVILAVWVVLMLVLFPAAYKCFDNMQVSTLGYSDESAEGEEILEKYFPGTAISNNPVLVVSYDSPNGRAQLLEQGDFQTKLIDWFSDIRHIEWLKKLDSERPVFIMKSETGASKGILVFGFTYDSNRSFDFVVDDTANLRDAIDSVVSEYLDDLGVKTKYFSTSITGNPAIYYDSGKDIGNTSKFVVIVVLLIALLLMGLFFGSVMTSIITTVSIAFSGVLSMALIYLFSKMFIIPSLIWLVVMSLTIALSFVHCVILISVYRKHILSGADKDDAIRHTVMNAGRIFIVSGLCIFVCGLIFALYDSSIIRALGISLALSVVATVATSLVIPAVLICVTKNEMFWMNSTDGTFKSKLIEKYYPSVTNAFDKVSSVSDRMSSRRCIAIISVISIIAVASAGYVVVFSNESSSYDITSSIITGESDRGLSELEEYGYGGIFQPYSIVLESKNDFGTISESIPFVSDPAINWSAFMTPLIKELDGLVDSIYLSDAENIMSVVSVEVWKNLVQEAKDAGKTESAEIINYIGQTLKEKDQMAYNAFQYELDRLRTVYLKSDNDIVNDCGPQMDYAMNMWLGDIGYYEDSEGVLHIKYVCVDVFTKGVCTTQRSIQTTDAIKDVVSSFMKDTKFFSNNWLSGVGVSFSNTDKEISNGYAFLVIIAIILSFVIIWAVEKDLAVPIAITVSSIIGVTISSAIIDICLPLMSSGSSKLTLLLMPLFCLMFCVLFGYLQIAMMRECGSISEMKKSFNPAIIVSAVVIALSSLLFFFSALEFVAQIGFSIAVIMLVDSLLIRMLFSPAVWEFGIKHKIKFFEKYSD